MATSRFSSKQQFYLPGRPFEKKFYEIQCDKKPAAAWYLEQTKISTSFL